MSYDHTIHQRPRWPARPGSIFSWHRRQRRPRCILKTSKDRESHGNTIGIWDVDEISEMGFFTDLTI